MALEMIPPFLVALFLALTTFLVADFFPLTAFLATTFLAEDFLATTFLAEDFLAEFLVFLIDLVAEAAGAAFLLVTVLLALALVALLGTRKIRNRFKMSKIAKGF